MAVRASMGYAVILNPFTQREIANSAWKMLLRLAAGDRFDGEIMVFPSMSPQECDHDIEMLLKMGFAGPDDPNPDFGLKGSPLPSWLEFVDVRYLDGSGREGRAWKLANSDVYTLVGQGSGRRYPTKGYEVDWPPFIGRISERSTPG